ncbi:MAG: alpha-L-fucosidase [Bacteroides sp.]|nr:alpha-L-fucosidase [Bacteroides sp.]
MERRIMKDVVCAHPWESCVTLSESWSYKENEEFRVADSDLIGIMCDIVSKGGRFLINIGPAPDGSIPESDKKALLAVGNWLKVNGEAIYGTKPMDCTEEKQSANEFDRAKDLLLPQKGINDFPSVWDQMLEWNQNQGPIRFTKNDSFVYAIHQGWPGKKLELQNISIKTGSKIRMLGVKKPLSWKAEEDKIIIKLPSKKPCEHAFVLRIEMDNHKL